MGYSCGVDPGLKGGVAVLDDRGNIAALHVMPVKDGEVDPCALASLLWLFWPSVDVAAVERVHSMPGQGVASTFCFGRGFGAVLGVMGALNTPVEMPTPQRWKRDILGDRFSRDDKQGCMDWVAQRFPAAQVVPPRCRVAHSGLTDALALAEWARLHSRINR